MVLGVPEGLGGFYFFVGRLEGEGGTVVGHDCWFGGFGWVFFNYMRMFDIGGGWRWTSPRVQRLSAMLGFSLGVGDTVCIVDSQALES